VYKYDNIDKSVLLLSLALSLAWYDIVNNQTPCVIVKVIADYDYIYNVIDYDYIASGNDYYNYLRSYNQLQSIMITKCLLYTLYQMGGGQFKSKIGTNEQTESTNFTFSYFWHRFLMYL